MGMISDLNKQIASAIPRSRINACGRRADTLLCQSAVNEIRGLVLDVGGVTEEEAELLLLVMDRLAKIQSRDGVEAARKAAAAVRRTWLEAVEEDEDYLPG